MIEWRETPPDPWAEALTDPAGRRRELGLTSGPGPVVLHVGALKALGDHGRDHPREEVGGLLLGRVHKQEDDVLVEVLEAVPAARTIGTSVHLAFTADSWDPLLETVATRGDDALIVGWYHTHPGLGVFLSGTDQHTHGHHFRQPWQVALVHDPHDGATGCFMGVPATPVAWQLAPEPSARTAAAVKGPISWSRLGLLGVLVALSEVRRRLRPRATAAGPRAYPRDPRP
ncbi:MAG: Mov34/MPN/PAD-1 family protein [Candidatus Sericytochromatia bacterium]|nr:Mov34/MPN/PAD-1 family protein [Candidatus Sericytochromatia bacterium]